MLLAWPVTAWIVRSLVFGPAHNLDQPALPHGVKEVHAAKSRCVGKRLRPAVPIGNRRRVRRHDRMFGQVRLHLPVELPLCRKGFDDRFHHQIAAGRLGQLGGRIASTGRRTSPIGIGRRFCAARRRSPHCAPASAAAFASWITTGSPCCTWAAAMAVPIMPAPMIPTHRIVGDGRADRPPAARFLPAPDHDPVDILQRKVQHVRRRAGNIEEHDEFGTANGSGCSSGPRFASLGW